jgi:hypothetical protein
VKGIAKPNWISWVKYPCGWTSTASTGKRNWTHWKNIYITYKNKSIFKEVIPHKKIVYEHVSAPRFTATIRFEDQGDQTLLTWHMLFETREEFLRVVKTFKADEGLKQNIEKLTLYLKAQLQNR